MENSRSKFFAFITKRTILNDVVQGIILGGVLAFFIATLLINHEFSAIQTTVNGWGSAMECGEPGNGMLLRAACAKDLPAVNVSQEAVYWTTTVDASGQTLNGGHDYILHFPAGQLPPNNAFWSLTMSDAQNQFVANSINRFSLGDRSNLVPNTDGSVDIYIQNSDPTGHESNWLPAPTGNFKLWLRMYLPGASILNGTYQVPSVSKTQ